MAHTLTADAISQAFARAHGHLAIVTAQPFTAHALTIATNHTVTALYGAVAVVLFRKVISGVRWEHSLI